MGWNWRVLKKLYGMSAIFFSDAWARDFCTGFGEHMGFGFLQERESGYC